MKKLLCVLMFGIGFGQNNCDILFGTQDYALIQGGGHCVDYCGPGYVSITSYIGELPEDQTGPGLFNYDLCSSWTLHCCVSENGPAYNLESIDLCNFLSDPWSGCLIEEIEYCDEYSFHEPCFFGDGEAVVIGCTDPEACNYYPDANLEGGNGSCEYEIDCAGVCGGNTEVDCAEVCGGSAVVDECGECGGDGSTCNENIFECLSDCPNYDEVYEYIELENDCIVCDFLEDDVWNNACSEDCGFDFWYVANDECDWECNIWNNQDECQSYDCIWDDNNFQCVDWPNYTECAEIYDEAYNLGFEEGDSIGAQSGDVNGDGELNVIDIVIFVEMILNP